MPNFMKIDGIKGDVGAKGYEGWIEVQVFSFAGAKAVSTPTGNAKKRQSSKTSMSELFISLQSGTQSTQLFQASTSAGEEGKDVLLHVVNAQNQPIFQYTFKNALVSSLNVEGKGGMPEENCAINFTQIEQTYTPYDETNKAGSPMSATYDIAAAAA